MDSTITAGLIFMLISKLGVSAVSRRVIDAALEYAEREKWPIMIVASRNQVEDEELGLGYTCLTMPELVRRGRELAPNYGMVCRDHGGPYFNSDDAGFPLDAAAERAVASLRHDVLAGVDLVHVDWSRGGGEVARATTRVVEELCQLADDKVRFEVGADETDGGVDDVEDFKKSLDVFADLLDVVEFVVGRTGTLVRERFQVGYFDFAAARRLTDAAHGVGFRFKEHNADYLTPLEIALRPVAGVDAVNIGPDLGVLETATIANLAALYGAQQELDRFFARAVASGRWRKWAYRADPTEQMKATVAGHYIHLSQEYDDLIGTLRERVDVDTIVDAALVARIDCYASALDGHWAHDGTVDRA
jgi:hypothetical protein